MKLGQTCHTPSGLFPRARAETWSPLRTWVARGLVALAFVGPLFVTPELFAQDDDALTEARSKFQRAIELKQAANYGGALKLFREVGAVKMTPQVRYHIATCEEKLGQLVAALGGYELAINSGDEMPAEFIAEVQSSIDDLKARIPKVIVERGEGAEAASIELDGVALGESSIGVEIPVNPGPHVVAGTAPGYELFQETITVEEGSVETLSIQMSKPQKAEESLTPPPQEPAPRFGLLPYVVGGSGIVVTIAGATLLGVSQVNVGKIKKICDGTDCSAVSDDDKDQVEKLEAGARGMEVAGWVGLGVGLAATTAGVVMYVLDRNTTRESVSARKTNVSVLPLVSERTFGFHLSGTF